VRRRSWIADPDTPVGERWNRNIHHHGLLLDALPDPCGRALDVGCGDGTLTWALADQAASVLAIDADAPSVERTRALLAGREHVTVDQADVMTADLAPGSFDAVLAVAVLHHLELRAGLIRLASLVAPGGVLGIVGLARSRSGYDLAFDAAGLLSTYVLRPRRMWVIDAPTSDPRETYTDVLRTATLLLPGVRYRRHPLFRCSLVWARPEGWSPPTGGDR
jgi:2-polyprenyl-3-methyl-5-hydroxy-6-metoxy-1,4-benzoquinol methylase